MSTQDKCTVCECSHAKDKYRHCWLETCENYVDDCPIHASPVKWGKKI